MTLASAYGRYGYRRITALLRDRGWYVGKDRVPSVAACGERASLLWAEGKVDAAIWLEELWNEIAITYDVDILCGYPSGGFRCEEDNHVFRRIREEHSIVHL